MDGEEKQPGVDHGAERDGSDIAQTVFQLRSMLGSQLVAYLGSVGETRTVRAWADGAEAPPEAVAERLGLAHEIALMLVQTEGGELTQSWFLGLNPELEASPARLIREGELSTVGPAVRGAASSFLAGA